MRAPWLQLVLFVAGAAALALVLNLWVDGRRPPVLPPPRLAEAPAVNPVSLVSRCESCHAEVTGLEAGHAHVGCAACHLGDASALDAGVAHEGMVRRPGNLSDVAKTCGAVGCHAEMPPRLEQNVMTTMNGVVSVDRWVFGEQATPTAETPVSALRDTPADTHLRNLCASCHLGAEKTKAGPVDERSRGGGCLACHLRYPDEARRDLEARGSSGHLRVHPQLRARPDELSCFGCHSRSGRVALSYRGWAEGEAVDGGVTRTLADGRALVARPADVHARAGLSCVDCHSASEVMGEGERALHREDQQQVGCADCHRDAATATTVALSEAGAQVERLVRLEGRDGSPGRRFFALARTGRALVSTRVMDGGAELERPGEAPLPLKPPAEACRAPAHREVSCPACHDAWAPQCFGCHTRWDPEGARIDLLTGAEREGAWRETPSDVRTEPAVLGVRERRVDGGVERRVEEFAPGMILTVNRSDGSPPRFSRLFAPAFPHTVQREVRECRACHASSRALGLGSGRLVLAKAGRMAAWRFVSTSAMGPDGLPLDAWTGFLAEPRAGASTREDARPLTIAEQRRVLDVAACLECHPAGSKVMDAFLADPAGTKARLGPRCVRLAK